MDTKQNNPIDDQATFERQLNYSFLRGRTLVSGALSTLVTVVTLSALIPLAAVLYMLVARGASHLSYAAFTELPGTPMKLVDTPDGKKFIPNTGGGFGNAIVGTILMVGIASLISVPVGILGAIFLAEVSPNSYLSKSMRFLIKLMTGFPSILAGMFVYGAVVMTIGNSAWAGGIALAILMLPTILLTAEESIRMVPAKMKDAAMAMGTTQSQMVRSVMFPTALPGIMTGIMLGVARACGETAPLIFTAVFSNYWIIQSGEVQIGDRTASLAVFIYNYSQESMPHMWDKAWAAAFVLVVMVLIFNLLGQAFSARQTK